MIGFWFLEVTSFLYVVNTLNFFVSGQMFPLDLLPSLLGGALLKALPVPVPGLFPGGGVPGQDSRKRAALGTAGRSRLGGRVHPGHVRALPLGPAPLQRLRRLKA